MQSPGGGLLTPTDDNGRAAFEAPFQAFMLDQQGRILPTGQSLKEGEEGPPPVCRLLSLYFLSPRPRTFLQ